MFERKSLGCAQFVARASIAVREEERPRDEAEEKVAVF